MSTAFSRRFITLVEQFAGGNKRQFAQLTGKSPSHIYRICQGLGRPSMTYLEHLYSLFAIDLNWLLTGVQASEPHRQHSQDDLLVVPKLDVEASAGFGAVNGAEDITEQFALNKRWLQSQLGVHSERLAFVSVRGDSMLPTLQHGDMVLVDLSQQQLSKSGVYIIQTQDGLMAKRLHQKSDHIAVISDNEAYPSWQITSDNAEQHGVAGRIVWCGRSL
ncbi:XRE family transcriptional regulator [Pseudoalteromonas sp. SMS1]|uniref:XRE family transcriptional regulator n=1 Tax=Pseudoalteromonas sp. SMS1 TaxID=2908894 RepID=UPI001F2A9D95|nr:XRE family transcriptional regulator [Pseudoalteromonas sp. SMS1]MCF2859241.1 XRE family transcriptional regulator [Pseudoalteromonas sp. SMS1]